MHVLFRKARRAIRDAQQIAVELGLHSSARSRYNITY